MCTHLKIMAFMWPQLNFMVEVSRYSLERCLVENNNRELIERFWKLKALYNLKKNIQCANTHDYVNGVQAYKTHREKRARAHTHTRMHAHRIARTHNANTVAKSTRTHARTHTHTLHTHTRLLLKELKPLPVMAKE